MDSWAIEAAYLDADDVVQVVSPQCLQRVREVMGTPPPEGDDTGPIVTRPAAGPTHRGEVLLESGGSMRLPTSAGEPLPLGYHVLVAEDGSRRDLIVSPGRCRLPQRRAWGLAVQLYAARSRHSWGIGELADLRALADWAAGAGAGFLLVNPLCAVAMGEPQQPSPYFPSSRRFRNPVYLRVEDVAGAGSVDCAAAITAGRALNADPRIDRDQVWRIKRPVLEAIFAGAAADPDFAEWRAAQGTALAEFATWSALADQFGNSWQQWPQPYRHPGSAAVIQFREGHVPAVAFHAWLQWQLARQLEQAGGRLRVVQDLPVGFDPHGADAWAWQEMLAFDAAIGAPPDQFNSQGQNWGVPPFVPWRLRQASYRPFIDSLRATMTDGGGLRIDHVMGLFRLWWIPRGADAADGAYVRYPSSDLLDIVALESVRAAAVVIGEDLGTVEAGVREAMAATGMLSYRLLWFEDGPPAHWPVQALGAVTTHDLPTVAGLWSGADLRDQQADGGPGDPGGQARLRATLAAAAALRPDATPTEAVAGAYRSLCASACTLLSATLEDALAVETRPNIPGMADRDNWCRALPVPIEQVGHTLTATGIAAMLKAACAPEPDPSGSAVTSGEREA